MYKNVEFNNSFIVTLHNDLIQADFTNNYTMIEQRILYSVLSNIEPHESSEEIIYRLRIQDFCDYFNIEKRNYAYFRNVAKELKEKTIGVENKIGEKQNKFIGWFEYCEYIDQQGYIEFELSKSIKPYLFNLEGNFTKIKLNVLLSFKYTYSLRLYQLLNKWSFRGDYTVDIEEFRYLIGIPIKRNANGKQIFENGKPKFKLEKYNHLKTKAIIPAMNEINELSDYKVKFKENKTGRKITSLTLSIEKKNIKKNNKKEEANKVYGKDFKEKYEYDSRNYYFKDRETGETVLFSGNERAKAIIVYNKIDDLNISALNQIEKLLLEIMEYKDYDIAKEMHILVNYTKSANSINNLEGFIISQMKDIITKLKQGQNVSVVSMLNIKRQEVLPDWFFQGLKEKPDEEELAKQQKEMEELLEKYS